MKRCFTYPAVVRAALVSIVCARIGVVTPAHGATGVLSGMEIERSDAGTSVRVLLHAPRRIVTWAPEDRGRLLEIRLAPLTKPDIPAAGRETLTREPDAEMPLREVTFESNPGAAGSLVLRFDRDVEFRVSAAPDLRSIVVTLPKSESAAANADPAGLVEQAKSAIVLGDYARAIELCSLALQAPESESAPVALELLGLARERDGQIAQAQAEYEAYLRRYPSGAGALRVRQRRDALVTRAAAAPDKLRDPKSRLDGADWSVHGTLSQFVRHDGTASDENDALLSDSALFSDVDVTARRRTSWTEVRARVTGGYVADLRHGSESEPDVDEVYVDVRDRSHRMFGTVGRQARSSGGVFGRLDGGLAGYRALEWLQIGAVGGFASDYSTGDDVDPQRYLYGLSLEIGPFFGALGGSVYGIEQRIDDMVDRRAVGGEIRYATRRISAFGALDFDVYYSKLNLGLALVTYTFDTGVTLSGTYDHRSTPILTTSNALAGQGAGDIDELRDTYTRSEIEDLARDRTATSNSATLSGSVPLAESWQLTGDLTWFELSGLDAAGGVEATPGTGDELFATTQVIASGIFGTSDITTAALRYADTSVWESIGTSLIARMPVGAQWRVSPRFLFDYRWLEADSGEQVIVRPSSRLEWTWRSTLEVELEAGGEWVSTDSGDRDDDPWGYFVSVGYRWSF